MTDEQHVHFKQQRLEVKVHCPRFVDVVKHTLRLLFAILSTILYIIASIIDYFHFIL